MSVMCNAAHSKSLLEYAQNIHSAHNTYYVLHLSCISSQFVLFTGKCKEESTGNELEEGSVSCILS